VRQLVTATRQANPSTARDRLRLAVPAIAMLLERLAARGESLRGHTARLVALLGLAESPHVDSFSRYSFGGSGVTVRDSPNCA
jgi:hypothetical protein